MKLFGPGNLFCGCSLNYKFNFLTWRCSNHLFHIERVVVQFSSVAQSCPNLCDPRAPEPCAVESIGETEYG